MTEHARFQPGDLVAARGREWVVLPSPDGALLRLRPLSGSEEDAQTLALALERPPVRPARFAPPAPDRSDTQDAARLLADAVRLSLRRGAGPFRSAAQLGVEPRAYQLVPLMMALKLPVVRLLIADDVGIGKTVEAALIAREMTDRGAVDGFTVLCPPHLVEQWVDELASKFDIDAVAVTSSRARQLERGLPASQSLFQAYPHTVVSLDYIKGDARRENFALHSPSLVIVDEAHACVGGGRGRHQRYEVLERLAADPQRHMLFLTATPHSGDEDAFDRLLGLLHPDFAFWPQGGDANARERYARGLARHFVQRRRPDIQGEGWAETRAFPQHLDLDGGAPFVLTGGWAAIQEDVLDYCLGVTERAGGDAQRRRLAFWGTLALMRCVGSSRDAALHALRNRRDGLSDPESVEASLLDEEQGLLADTDVEPSTGVEAAEERGALDRLIAAVERLNPAQDPKRVELDRQLTTLHAQEANPIVFCRFIATAEALGEALARRHPDRQVLTVTGRLLPDERRARINALDLERPRLLVATDCLSEGLNLQDMFDAVVHYDLSWNPTRHQQREGRVDRFGQRSKAVRTVMMYGENSMIDGAVLEVITRKAEAIRKATGVSVPVPDDAESVASALMQAVLLRSRRPHGQGVLDLFGGADTRMERRWRDAEVGAKASRARYAQGAMAPEEVLPEWRAIRALNGGPPEVERFVTRALARVGAPIDRGGRVHADALPETLRERLSRRGFSGSRAVGFADDLQSGVAHVGRTHPLVATLAESMSESALDPEASGLARPLGRAGAWRSRAVTRMTTLLLLRLRFTLTTSGRTNRLLLAEEATGIAFGGVDAAASLVGLDALALLETEAAGNLAPAVIEKRVSDALARLDVYEAAIEMYATARAQALSDDHGRLVAAAGGGATTKVEPVLPADVLGIYVLLPEDL
ncbi:RNA polymerase-associated protein RapA [Methylobacterium brachiatum]|nr:RNA polymerase-associated protein RapA [Methylobacterium brachiatum]